MTISMYHLWFKDFYTKSWVNTTSTLECTIPKISMSTWEWL